MTPPPLPLHPGLAPVAAEIATYFRELPRLLADGHAGRVVLVRGDQVVGVWDTDEEAYEVGAERFGFGPYLAQPVDARDLTRLAPYFPASAGGVPA